MSVAGDSPVEQVAELAAGADGNAPGERLDPDADLVRRIQCGDQRAFQTLMVKYQRRVARHVARYVKRSCDVDDLVQEIFLKVYRGLPSFRSDSSFHTWLHSITRNAALNFVTRQPDVEVLSSDALVETANDLPGSCFDREAGDPERVLIAKEIAAMVERAVSGMGRDLAEPLLLYEEEGKQYKEIASLLQVPIGTVRTRIFRARAFITARLRPVAGSMHETPERRPQRRFAPDAASQSIGMPT